MSPKGKMIRDVEGDEGLSEKDKADIRRDMGNDIAKSSCSFSVCNLKDKDENGEDVEIFSYHHEGSREEVALMFAKAMERDSGIIVVMEAAIAAHRLKKVIHDIAKQTYEAAQF